MIILRTLNFKTAIMKRTSSWVILIFFIQLAGCSSPAKKSSLVFDVVGNSHYAPDSNYSDDLSRWKKYYEACTGKSLFPDAFYMQLQDRVYIGSINNERQIDVNEAINILDTADNRSIFNLLNVTNASNCRDTMELSNSLRRQFFSQIKSVLNHSAEIKYLIPALDSGAMRITIETLYTNILEADTLLHLLNTSPDSSHKQFKDLLFQPGNVILGKTVEAFGFDADLPLTQRLSKSQEADLQKDIFINANASGSGTVVLKSNGWIHIKMNKRFTVLGSFMQLKEN